jgi:hypothetical protein
MPTQEINKVNEEKATRPKVKGLIKSLRKKVVINANI